MVKRKTHDRQTKRIVFRRHVSKMCKPDVTDYLLDSETTGEKNSKRSEECLLLKNNYKYSNIVSYSKNKNFSN